MAVFSNKEEKSAEKWRNVFFHHPDGRAVLEEILAECHTFESVPLDDVAQVQMHNFGVWMLYKLGVYEDANISKILDKFVEIPYKES